MTTHRTQPHVGTMRRGGGIRRFTALAAPAVLAATAPFVGAQETQPAINPAGHTRSDVCGQCHKAIYDVWKQSLHSQSWTNAVFQAGYRRAAEVDKSGARMCFSCHAPTVRVTKDYAAQDPITSEGVTCDFCHSVMAVDLSDRADPMRLDAGITKYGPMRHAKSPVHEVKASPLHAQSEFCAGCHEYRNADGIPILATYSEWKSSEYARKGTHCQDCHMPLVPGRVVTVEAKADSPSQINLHNISGSHNLERVRSAVTMNIKKIDRFDSHVWVYVQVANVGSGHGFPTGLPLHRAVLLVTVRSRGVEIDRYEYAFEAVLQDKEGRTLTRECDLFLKAAGVRKDTRLAPGEKRMVVAHFSNVGASQIDVNASLTYEYATERLVQEEKGERFEPVRMKFTVVSANERVGP